MDELEVNNSEFTLAQVRDWVVAHMHPEGRFHFFKFKVYRPNSLFYQRIALPLLSMCTTGSIDVEWAAKPYKNRMLTKDRNCISDEKGIVLFRGGRYLKHLAKAKMELKGTVHDTLNNRN